MSGDTSGATSEHTATLKRTSDALGDLEDEVRNLRQELIVVSLR